MIDSYNPDCKVLLYADYSTIWRYGNGMVISIDPDCKVLLYADDSTILFSHRDPDQIANNL